MIDFWMAFILTMMVTILTILADWIASRFIVGTRTLRSLQQIVQSGISSNDAEERIKEELERYRLSLSNSLAWGSDLAIVAISMDFAALGIWIHNPILFPFFSRFNDLDTSREIPIWLIVVGFHSILLIISLGLKHIQAINVAGLQESTFSRKAWISQNGWKIASNSTGFISLLTSIVLFTNAV